MKRDLISIIVLVYNTERYVKRCLESIINQTYQNTEIIVINNGSTDKSSKIINNLAKKDDRIQIIEHENKGVCYSRIEGYKLAKGRFIMYVDSDDYIENDMLDIMYKNLKGYNVDIVKCQYKNLKNNKIEIPKNILNRNVCMNLEQFEPQFFDLLYKTEHCNQINKQLMKRKLLKNILKIEDSIIYREDLLLNLSIYKEMNSILFIPDELYICNCDSKLINNVSINQKLIDAINVYYALFKSVSEFKIKNKKYYKKVTSILFIDNINILLKEIVFNTQIKHFKDDITIILNNRKVKEILKYMRNNNIHDELRCNNYKVKIFYYLFIYNQISVLYYFYKLLNLPKLTKKQIENVNDYVRNINYYALFNKFNLAISNNYERLKRLIFKIKILIDDKIDQLKIRTMAFSFILKRK